MIDFSLLRNRQSAGNVSLGKQDPMTDFMYAGQRRFPGQFAGQVSSNFPSALKQQMLKPDVVGDRWGLGSYDWRMP